MDPTPNLSLPYIAAAQAQKHVTHNEAIRALDAIVQLAVLDRDFTAPPATPSDGDRFIVAVGANGDWAGHDGSIAAWQDGAWMFYAPQEGWLVWIGDEQTLVAYDGAAWVSVGGGGGGAVGSLNPATGGLVGINATADLTNRLNVASPAVLFDHDGDDSQVKINKAANTDTAALLFQTAYSGRAEFGLAGNDDFHVKVSADGTSWHEAMVVTRSTGEVSFPNTTISGAGAIGQNLIINGDFQINQRNFSGGSLSAAVYGFDRWKAGGSGASLSRSGFVASLASGSIAQVIEPASFGIASLAASTLTLSVEAPSANIAVTLGSASGIITAGSGRRSLMLTLGAGDSGNLTLNLSSSGGGPVSFGRVKLEVGSSATVWQARPAPQEYALAIRYFRRGYIAADFNAAANEVLVVSSPFPSPMRVAPTMAFGNVVAQSNMKAGTPLFHALSTTNISAAIQLVADATARTYWYGYITADAEL